MQRTKSDGRSDQKTVLANCERLVCSEASLNRRGQLRQHVLIVLRRVCKPSYARAWLLAPVARCSSSFACLLISPQNSNQFRQRNSILFHRVPSYSARVGTKVKNIHWHPVSFHFRWLISIVRGVLAGNSRRSAEAPLANILSRSH